MYFFPTEHRRGPIWRSYNEAAFSCIHGKFLFYWKWSNNGMEHLVQISVSVTGNVYTQSQLIKIRFPWWGGVALVRWGGLPRSLSPLVFISCYFPVTVQSSNQQHKVDIIISPILNMRNLTFTAVQGLIQSYTVGKGRTHMWTQISLRPRSGSSSVTACPHVHYTSSLADLSAALLARCETG